MRPAFVGSIAAAGVLALAGCGGDDEDSEITAFCDKVEETRTAESPFEGLAADDVEGAKAALEEARDLFGEVAATAPEEIQGDVEEVQGFFDDLAASVEGAKTPEEFTEITTEFQTRAAEFEETSDRLETYTDEQCGPVPEDEEEPATPPAEEG